jgi:hypothetical protein
MIAAERTFHMREGVPKAHFEYTVFQSIIEIPWFLGKL